MKEPEVITYRFPIKYILEQCTGRTAMLARQLGTQDNPDRVDELTITEGEFPRFKGLLISAVGDVYGFTKPFARRLENGFLCGTSIFDDIVFFQERLPWFDTNAQPLVENALEEAIVNHIISRWFLQLNEDKIAEKYWGLFNEAAEKVKVGMDSERKPMRRQYRYF